MIIARMSELLFIPIETIDPSKCMADYGIDSLIGVELRAWFVRTLSAEVSFLKLLDSYTSIQDLAQVIVMERKAKMD